VHPNEAKSIPRPFQKNRKKLGKRERLSERCRGRNAKLRRKLVSEECKTKENSKIRKQDGRGEKISNALLRLQRKTWKKGLLKRKSPPSTNTPHPHRPHQNPTPPETNTPPTHPHPTHQTRHQMRASREPLKPVPKHRGYSLPGVQVGCFAPSELREGGLMSLKNSQKTEGNL